MLSVVTDDGSSRSGYLIDEIVREGARRMFAAVSEPEVGQHIAELAGERDEVGRRMIVRYGHQQPRSVVTAAGPVQVRAPRVDGRRVDEGTGERKRFSSEILPPWCRESPWADGVHPKVRIGQAHSCVLVRSGARFENGVLVERAEAAA